MNSVLRFNWLDDDDEQNDEACRITLDGSSVITMNHDDHGWDGMVGIRDALLAVAASRGWEVRVDGQSGI